MLIVKKIYTALDSVTQWIERWPATPKVNLIPSKVHAWVAGQVPSRGRIRGNHIATLLFLSLSFSSPSPL